MPFSLLDSQHGRVLKLEGAVTIRNAQELASTLGEKLDDSTSMGVDTQNLEDIDTCILQILCSLTKTLSKVSFDKPSNVFIRALDRCGMRRELLGAREIQ